MMYGMDFADILAYAIMVLIKENRQIEYFGNFFYAWSQKKNDIFLRLSKY